MFLASTLTLGFGLPGLVCSTLTHFFLRVASCIVLQAFFNRPAWAHGLLQACRPLGFGCLGLRVFMWLRVEVSWLRKAGLGGFSVRFVILYSWHVSSKLSIFLVSMARRSGSGRGGVYGGCVRYIGGWGLQVLYREST